MQFDFATSGRIRFGPGSVAELPAAARAFGLRAFVVTGRDRMRHAPRIDALEGAGFKCVLFSVAGEPAVALAREGAALARASAAEVVIAIGGGSALDAGKAIAALATNPGDPLEYLEVIGRGRSLTASPLPFIAVPTTAGTGAEVTRNAVLGSPEHRAKVSLRSAAMLPRVAIVDPDLALGLSPATTAATGLDAITQLIEGYVCTRANPLTDALAMEGLRRAIPALPVACAEPRNREARAAMAWAALASGMVLANAGLGVIHALAAPIGGRYGAPHGAVCAALLAPGCAANIGWLRAHEPESPSLARYAEIARVVTGDPSARPEDGAQVLGELARKLGIPGLSAYGMQAGVPAAALAELAFAALRTSSFRANPAPLSEADLHDIIRASQK